MKTCGVEEIREEAIERKIRSVRLREWSTQEFPNGDKYTRFMTVKG